MSGTGPIAESKENAVFLRLLYLEKCPNQKKVPDFSEGRYCQDTSFLWQTFHQRLPVCPEAQTQPQGMLHHKR
jgi:hypothetical protein